LKGVASEQDTRDAIKMGFDGIILSNHGGRQLDAAQSTIATLKDGAEKYKDQIEIMMDSGLRSGPDIARTIASGAKFTFMGRSFMYGVGALGDKGGDHTIGMLKTQFKQVMDQLCCERVEDLPKHLIS
jgi:L-lactate dehydrogenase (cytochrome)